MSLGRMRWPDRYLSRCGHFFFFSQSGSLREVFAVAAMGLGHVLLFCPRARLGEPTRFYTEGRSIRRVAPTHGHAPARRHRIVTRARQEYERGRDPRRLGFSMPAEWEPHEATWLGWPHNPTDWPDKLDTIRWVYGEIVRKIAPGESVRILVDSAAEEERLARRYLARAGATLARVRVHRCTRPTAAGRATAVPSSSAAASRRQPRRPSCISTSTPGPSTPTGGRTAACRRWRRGVLRKRLFHAQVNGRRVRPRRRRHRRQRPRHAADDRGVLPRPAARRCAIRARPRGLRGGAAGLPRRDQRLLAGRRGRGRRHARARRRHLPLRDARRRWC